MSEQLNIIGYASVLDIRFARTATLVDIGERVSAGLSLKRRKASNRLSAAESQRLSRSARIWAAALDVYHDENQVRRFIGKPHPLLNNRTPVDVAIESDEGCRAVEDVLVGLKHGTAA
jgi:putative toxin-antitoxin system antitoxin component (TIGR02293 family)